MTQEQLKEMRDRVQHLHKFLRITDRTYKIENDRQLSLSEGFWNDNTRATAILKEIKINKYWLDLYSSVADAVEDFAVLFDFWKEGESSEDEVREAHTKAINALDELEFKSTLNRAGR